MKIIKKVIVSVLLGIFLILGINYLGQYVNINIPVNVFNVCVVGLLRLPGVIVLLILLRIY